MKKALLYFAAFLFICFLLPAFFTKKNIKVNSENIIENQEKNQEEELNKNEQSNQEKNKQDEFE